MPPLVTADCKEYLTTKYPDLPIHSWNKEDKTKATNGDAHWVFSNNLLADNVFLLESNGALQFDPAHPIPSPPSVSAVASKYLYSIVDSNTTGAFGIVFNLVATWNKFSRLSEKDLQKPVQLLPSDWEMTEVEQNHWFAVGEGASSEHTMMEKLEHLGFVSNPQFDEFVGGRSHNNSDSYASYKQTFSPIGSSTPPSM